MGKKKVKSKAPPPLPELTPELNEALCKIQALQRGGFVRVQLRKGKERMAKELIAAAVDGALKEIRSNELGAMVPRYAAKSALAQMGMVMGWATFEPESSPMVFSAPPPPRTSSSSSSSSSRAHLLWWHKDEEGQQLLG